MKIVAVGDIMLGDHPVRFGNGVRSSIEEKGAEYLFLKVANFLKGNDIAFANLEVVHSDRGLNKQKIESMEFRGSPLSIPVLRKAGFNVVSFANNHCMEHGPECFWETVDILKKNNIYAAGIKGADGYSIPVEFTKNDSKVVLLSYSFRHENYHKTVDIPYMQKDEERVLDEVKYFKTTTDILIVSLHWGEEFMDYPSPRQVLFAHRLVDAGASMIIGHHPHVLQGIEKYQRAMIAYSLGNFVFDMWQNKTRETLILQMECSAEETNIKLIPVHISSSFQPEPLEGKAHDTILKKIESLNRKIQQEYIENGIDTWKSGKVELMEQHYVKLANRMMLKHRLGNYAYFLAHLFKYKPLIIMQSLNRFFLRRVEGL